MKLGLSKEDRLVVIAMYAAIAIITVASLAAAGVIGRSVALILGLSLTTYFLGVRHGLDADHIAAIDNVTRRLTNGNRRPLTVGAWFSLGHSTIVFALTVAITLAASQVLASEPRLAAVGSLLGTGISVVFLWLIGIVNFFSAIQIYRTLRLVRDGQNVVGTPNIGSKSGGILSRLMGGLFDLVSRPWQIYPIGVLFGLGFDTATEIALISLSVIAAVGTSFSIWAVLILPATFACGMVLVDTTDGVMMSLAYGWALLQPMRKIFYNLTVTVGSIVVAFLIGWVELLQILTQELGLKGFFWAWLGGIDFDTLGLFVVAAFGATWVVSMSIYRIKRFGRTLPLPNAK